MTVSLPSGQKDNVKEQATATGGLDSPARQMTASGWKELRTALKTKLGKRKKIKKAR